MLEHEIENVPQVPAGAGVVGTMSFGARLRAERERRQISIASIADKTKILGALLEALEHDDVSRWPSGFYRRAFFRAYAGAIGLDTESVLKEFAERFPDTEDTFAFPSIDTDLMASPTANHPLLRLTLADGGPFFSGGPVIRSLRPRLRAVALDAFVLSVIGLSLFVVLGAFWAPLSVAVAAYYFVSILILGNTPGVCLFASHAKAGPNQMG